MVDRAKVIEGLKHCNFGDCGFCYENDCPYYQSHDCTDELKNDILSLLKELPEIIRCKYCKYSKECIPPCEERYCVFYDERHDGGWFCADGERADKE